MQAWHYARLAFSALALSLAMATGAADAQAPGNAFSGYRDNASKPIDIEADLLEVDDKKQVATFKGNVFAVQGDFNLRAKELEVVYSRGGGSGAATPAPAGGAQDALAGGDIRFIRARGDVLVNAKDNKQTATSNEAFFDVKAQKVTLAGDVTLSQGGNVIKGDKLLIDIATGMSTFEQGEGGKQRLRAVFRRPEGGDEAKPQPGAQQGSGWQTQNQ